jgi:hypothetical protein
MCYQNHAMGLHRLVVWTAATCLLSAAAIGATVAAQDSSSTMRSAWEPAGGENRCGDPGHPRRERSRPGPVGAAAPRTWVGRLDETGDYRIDVVRLAPFANRRSPTC